MGFDFSKIKDMLTGKLGEHNEKIDENLGKAGDFFDDKTGGKFGDTIDGSVDKAEEFVDKLSDDDKDERK